MTWTQDKAHSQILFSARHMMITNVRGSFNSFEVTVDFDENNLSKASVEATIDANSISTRDERRDGHLRSPDFLDVAKYPHITFKSTKVELTGKTTGRVTGNLTIRNVTKPITLDVELVGIMKSPMGSTNAGFNAQTKLNRKDWDLNWNVALEAGWLATNSRSRSNSN